MQLSKSISKRNFKSLLWHAGFLAIATNFIDIDTVIPAMVVDAGGKAIHIGILSAIMLGGSSFTQLIFAPFISNFPFKKKFLLLGINSRIFSLLALSLLLYYSAHVRSNYEIFMIFFFITIFSLGGAFANISYTDIMGKSIIAKSRKSFLSIKKVVNSSLLLLSVFAARYVLKTDAYPVNYAYMFFIGFIALFLASFGFWNLKEAVPSKFQVRGPVHFIRIIRAELNRNSKLKNFLGFVNTMGVSISILPFIILYAHENLGLESKDTGNFLLFKVAGSVLIGLLLVLLKSRYKYRWLLHINAGLAVLVPLVILLVPDISFLNFLFLIGGIIYATYSITLNGVLLEVSDTGNRALYTGIAGAGNILPAVFPVFGGWVISTYGFEPFFVLFIAVILTSFYFINKLNCKQ